jgi:uncharacterized damage-inducible protein DinB
MSRQHISREASEECSPRRKARGDGQQRTSPNGAKELSRQMTNSDQYAARLNSYTEGKDSLAMQTDAPEILTELIYSVSTETLHAQPAPGKWSVAEILAHLADDELVTSWRYRQMLENPGCALTGFDQDKWARLGDYANEDPASALQLFRLLREANLRLLRRLTPEELQSHGIHAERGKITVQDLARHMAGHDMNHINQIRKILKK